MIIGIIGAMEKEIVLLKEKMIIEKTVNQSSLEFYVGKLNDKEVVLVRSGIGKVNAAMCTQILVDIYNVELIINTGVAGALHPDLNVGDIVVSTDTLQHDIDASVFGDPRGIIPGMDKSVFLGDEKLLGFIDDITLSDQKILKGRIVTGDQAIGCGDTKTLLYEQFEGFCVEMEGGAIAHVCHLNNIPFLIIRAISDKADEEVEVNYNEFLELAAKNSSFIVESILSNIEIGSMRKL
ncbi:5'-methylthioadenosine/adenosylhomocysteine nucleosidase [Alkalibaculum sp. M08DMB]|uniref:adenosylhomocysteine nucleosidase n=1 Tax=Alkalibaculum sporogenes TaxID=2655001 RepID=A0A6A7K844_9FIRM|nr:5'-methylthioadenosine/adenosylhomocysteine nucleosidase [Alkalibaculum sporogenes]MPW25387.1 5'-methylthioadenosine/adenosylhomocysteine nucleosidase [Alkalibaculum sporogenes]